jgi:hypothetical protein
MAYKIIGTHEFYGPETREIEVDQLVTDEHGNDKHMHIFETEEAAQAYIDELESERYYLLHNESARPTYRIEQV